MTLHPNTARGAKTLTMTSAIAIIPVGTVGKTTTLFQG